MEEEKRRYIGIDFVSTPDMVVTTDYNSPILDKQPKKWRKVY